MHPTSQVQCFSSHCFPDCPVSKCCLSARSSLLDVLFCMWAITELQTAAHELH